MSLCPKCETKVATDAAICPHCGAELVAVSKKGTIRQDGVLGDPERADDTSEHPSGNDAEPDSLLNETLAVPGTTTPGDRDEGQEEPPTQQIDQTISADEMDIDSFSTFVDQDASLRSEKHDPFQTIETESSHGDDERQPHTENEATSDDVSAGSDVTDHSTFDELETLDSADASDQDAIATLDLYGDTSRGEEGQDGNEPDSTRVASDMHDANETDETDETDEADEADELGDAKQEDQRATLDSASLLDSDSGEGGALPFDSTLPGSGDHFSFPSGTEGRLKKLWKGVAGSSRNPMHSLHAVGLQASDSIFERVAVRVVTEPGTPSGPRPPDYRIIDKLGEGAMGVVYTARQTGIDRLVAIKSSKPEYQNSDESRRRFLYEAQITGELDHSNIVPIHELGATQDGILFYSMKLVEGSQWDKVIRQKSLDENLDILLKVTDAMAFAHSKGVIHRDLKPENTMLGRFGEVFVTDWGTAFNLERDSTALAEPASRGQSSITVAEADRFSAGDVIYLHDGIHDFDRLLVVSVDRDDSRLLHVRRRLTRQYEPSEGIRVARAMNLAGTPCYMAPEMAASRMAKIGYTSDIYILGAILYEIVRGRPPHIGKSVTQCLKSAVRNEIVAEQTDDPLLAIAFKAMASDPRLRFQSVEELQAALREYRRHAESVALSERSDASLRQAIKDDDYELFSRSLFGYRDAIELWPGNQAAVAGLRRARLAFGQAAYGKGDFDLVLQTLDRSVEDEQALYLQAERAKRNSLARDAKLRWLQRAVAAVILIAVGGLSLLSLYAWNERAKAIGFANDAKSEAERAQDAADKEKRARAAAELATIAAKRATRKEIAARAEAEMKTQEALAAKIEAEVATVIKEEALIKESEAREAAESAQEQERIAKEQAATRAAQIQIGEYKASLALAKSQLEAFDVQAARSNLARLRDMEDAGFDDLVPDFDSWGWRRMDMLSNSDLPTRHIQEPVTATSTAPQLALAAWGSADGTIELIQSTAQGFAKIDEFVEGGSRIDAIAISPTGKELAYAYSGPLDSGIKRWIVGKRDPIKIEGPAKRRFENLAFVADGKKLMAGIKSGIWLWNLDQDADSEPLRIIDIRGALQSVQSIDVRHAFVTIRFQSELLLGVVDCQRGTLELVVLPEELAGTPLESAAYAGVADAVFLGLSDNRLLVGQLEQSGRRVIGLRELDSPHRAPVSIIRSDGRGRIATASDAEPVAHVWSWQDSEWRYETHLIGGTSNLAALGFMDSGELFGLHDSGQAIAWNVERQKQRRQIKRHSDGEPVHYAVPVVAVAAGAYDGRAVALDAHGIADVWNLSDGSTQALSSQRYSYFGHTPGAEFVDFAVDTHQGIVVTSCDLSGAVKNYLARPNDAWEFCIWDANTGYMRRRWTEPNRQLPNSDERESVEQRISLLDQGKRMLLASDHQTIVFDVDDGKEIYRNDQFGSYFAVSHPLQPSLTMLVKRTGAVRLLDLNKLAGEESGTPRQFALANSETRQSPLQGRWSEDGQRFYLAFNNGELAQFTLGDSRLQLSWVSRNRPIEDDVGDALANQRWRVTSHFDLDLVVTAMDEGDLVHLAARKRTSQPSTRKLSIVFPTASEPRLLEPASIVPELRWLQARAGMKPDFQSRPTQLGTIDSGEILAKSSVESGMFFATRDRAVYRLSAVGDRVLKFGRAMVHLASGDREGHTILALLEDGAVWKFQPREAPRRQWRRLPFDVPQADALELSPDGRTLFVIYDGHGKLLDADSGAVTFELEDVAAAAWDPQADGTLATCDSTGRLTIVSDGSIRNLQEQVELKDARVRGLHYFVETWKDSAQSPRRYLLVHVDRSDRGAFCFVPLEEDNATPREDEARATVAWTEIAKGSRVETSPREGIIATGSPSGTVSLWFATPTWDLQAGALFELEGHRGASITCLKFSADGETLITTDNKNRLFAWPSSGPNSPAR